MNVDAWTTRRRGLGAAVAMVLCLLSGAQTAEAALSITAAPSAPRPGEAVTFSASGDCEGTCELWTWDVGPETSFASGSGYPAPAIYAAGFAAPGSYKVRLTYVRVQDAQWIVETVERDVTVAANRAPAASFTVSPVTPSIGQAVTFTDTSTDPEDDALTRAWSLDDDGVYDDGDGGSASRTFQTPGARTVRLRTTDRFGAESVSEQTVVVANLAPIVTVDVAPATVTTDEPVALSATGSDPDGGAVTYAWDLDGDGEFDDSTDATPPPRSYPTAGVRTLGVRVTDDDGDPASSTVERTFTVTVTDPPPTTTDPAAALLPSAPAPQPPAPASAPPVPPSSPAAPTGAARETITPIRAPRLIRPFPRVRIQGRLTRRGARFSRITVTAPRGSRVTAQCRGRGCPSATRTGVGRTGFVRLSELLGTYRAGTRIVILVTRAGAIGKHTTIVVRRGRAPQRVDRCLRPGATVPTRCPAN